MRRGTNQLPGRANRSTSVCLLLAVLLVAVSHGQAQEQFTQLLGPVEVKPVADAAEWEVPFITWGGDVATFLANGGLETTPEFPVRQAGLEDQTRAGR